MDLLYDGVLRLVLRERVCTIDYDLGVLVAANNKSVNEAVEEVVDWRGRHKLEHTKRNSLFSEDKEM